MTDNRCTFYAKVFLLTTLQVVSLRALATGAELQLKQIDQLQDREVRRYEQVYQGHVIDGAELVEVFNNQNELMFTTSKLVTINSNEFGDIPEVKFKPSNLRKQLISELEMLRPSQNKPNLRMALDSSLNLVKDLKNSIEPLRSETRLKFQDGKLIPLIIVSNLKVGRYILPFRLEIDGSTQTIKRLLPASLHLSPTLEIYNANFRPLVPLVGKGDLELVNGKRRGLFIHKASRRANETFRTVTDMFKTEFGRDSYDGQGSKVTVIVNVQRNSFLDIFKLRQNAAWSLDLKLFLLGGGNSQLDNFEKATDVVAHEFTHAVIDTSSGLKYEGQSGALNEHFADLFGALVENKAGKSNETNRFLIGDSVVKPDLIKEIRKKEGRDIVAIRDMLHPNLGLTRQPEHIRDIPPMFDRTCSPTMDNDSCGVHYLSGIPNRATALMIESLGFEKLQKVFYYTMMSRVASTSNFADYVEGLKEECRLHLTAEDCEIVSEALKETGLIE